MTLLSPSFFVCLVRFASVDFFVFFFVAFDFLRFAFVLDFLFSAPFLGDGSVLVFRLRDVEEGPAASALTNRALAPAPFDTEVGCALEILPE